MHEFDSVYLYVRLNCMYLCDDDSWGHVVSFHPFELEWAHANASRQPYMPLPPVSYSDPFSAIQLFRGIRMSI